MNEEELEAYLDAIDAIDNRFVNAEPQLVEQLRDECGERVPGCHRVLPAPHCD